MFARKRRTDRPTERTTERTNERTDERTYDTRGCASVTCANRSDREAIRARITGVIRRFTIARYEARSPCSVKVSAIVGRRADGYRECPRYAGFANDTVRRKVCRAPPRELVCFFLFVTW